MLLRPETAPVLDPETEPAGGQHLGHRSPPKLCFPTCVLPSAVQEPGRVGQSPRKLIPRHSAWPLEPQGWGWGVGAQRTQGRQPAFGSRWLCSSVERRHLSLQGSVSEQRSGRWATGFGALRPPGKVTVSSPSAVFPVALRGRLLVEGRFEENGNSDSER